MNFAIENPKATVTAAIGVIVFVLKTFVLKDSFTPELESWLNILLPTVFLFLIGRFTRITKSEAKVLTQMEDNKNQLLQN